MYVQYIRELNSQMEQSPSPPLLLKIRAGYWRQGKPSTESSMHSMVKIYCMYDTQGSVGRSLNVYVMYKMRVISQNNRRKAIADADTNWFQIELFISLNI
jgi:hypothetical protein